ncbi:glycosyltransferase [methane-oxidizing endosymbiont of Gigantopelta aegis]|uniref:glycosyltransferase n=1 Tax=methane-oxidizing endosymbiont of Gigantopelta aegis TaxID=2794938 RepID=UPI0018DCEE5C
MLYYNVGTSFYSSVLIEATTSLTQGDAERQPKFAMQGEVENLPQWPFWAFAAVSLGLLITLLFLANHQRLKLSGILFFGLIVNLAASMLAWTAALGVHQYQTLFSATLWGLLLLMQALAILVLLVESLELVEVLWSRNNTRQFRPVTPPDNYRYPKVSLHVPIHNEPPEMVVQTLTALDQLDYPNLEVLVIDNNTTDAAVWRPVERHCQRLGPHFRFFHLENWPGYKAGALNYALTQTCEDAEIIAVIDSDYQVSRDWLKKMIPHFDNPSVGFVQSPQNYHDWQQSLFKTCCQWEYAGFFHIGMVQRNEHNAIIQHGTMTMIRKSALEAVGQWGEWCICEDSELGLRLYKAGYDSVYAPDTFGKGLTPDTFSGYIGQRHRWVYGAMQILKRHARSLFKPGKTELTAAQRYHFIAGWLPWFSDALALLFTLASLILTGLVLLDPEHRELPVIAFILPILGLFGFKILRSFWLYSQRVRCGFFHTLGATLAGLALTHTVAIALWQGLFTSGRPFLRTPKCEQERPFFAGLMTIRQEILLLLSLWAAAFLLSQQASYDNLSGHLWIVVLLIQSAPYLMTLLIFLINVIPNLLPFLPRQSFNTTPMQQIK